MIHEKYQILYSNDSPITSEGKPRKVTSSCTNSAQEIQINIVRMIISISKCQNLLGIHIDKKLTSDPHVKSLCKKASQKLNAFARIAYSLYIL